MVDCSGLENRRRVWLKAPVNGGFCRFDPALYAQFLLDDGYGGGNKVGTPPALYPDMVETPWPGFQRQMSMGIHFYTYFARGLDTGRIKIGKSKQPEKRVRQFAHEPFGERCDLLVKLRGGHFERAYQNLFREHREIGEWFAPHPDILAEIERLA